VSDYQWDVFISYSRKGDAPEWVRNHFHPRLLNSLDGHLRDEPNIFLDKEMEAGTHWPNHLERALRHAKILVPVYSPQYFRSPWCLAEWDSFVAREKALGLGTSKRPQGLIFPVLFSDSENFPQYARERSWYDFKQWNVPYPVFQQTPEYVDFYKEVERFAAKLATLLDQVPAWQARWPVYRPDAPLPPPTRLPVFS
jgi:hypothetical protein